MDNYTETSREDFNGSETASEITVAAPSVSVEEALLPRSEGTEAGRVINYRKPSDFEGEVFTELGLHGLLDLRERDLTAIEKAFYKTGVSSFVPESTTAYAKIVATKVTGLPAEYFEDLPVGEIEKIKNAVVGFFYKDE